MARITVQVLNGATGETRELVMDPKGKTEQESVDIIFRNARLDDYYYRFLGMRSVLTPSSKAASPFQYSGQTWFERVI